MWDGADAETTLWTFGSTNESSLLDAFSSPCT